MSCAFRAGSGFRGGGSLVAAPAGSLSADTDRTTDLWFADVDGDGRPDLVRAVALDTTSGMGQNRLYRNAGMGRFVDATGRLPAAEDHTRGVVAADVDRDGDLDLVFVSGTETSVRPRPSPQDRLYINDGTGTFTEEISSRLGRHRQLTICRWAARSAARRSVIGSGAAAQPAMRARVVASRDSDPLRRGLGRARSHFAPKRAAPADDATTPVGLAVGSTTTPWL
ncbi:MAG: VCBS repeat-containing protein [Planctomycetota bacterium]